MTSRQEVANVLLAELLCESGFAAAPEQVLRRFKGGTTSLPDVLLDYKGLRLAIEAEFKHDSSSARRAADKALERVELGVAHLAIAVVYPAKLQSVPFEKMKSALQDQKFEFAVVTEANSPIEQQYLFSHAPALPDFVSGSVQTLVEALHRSYERLVADDVVSSAVAKIEASMSNFVAALDHQPATFQRLANELGGESLGPLTARKRGAIARVSTLIIANALIFHEVLSQTHPAVYPLRTLKGVRQGSLVGRVGDHWQMILDEINYFPIFSTARACSDRSARQ